MKCLAYSNISCPELPEGIVCPHTVSYIFIVCSKTSPPIPTHSPAYHCLVKTSNAIQTRSTSANLIPMHVTPSPPRSTTARKANYQLGCNLPPPPSTATLTPLPTTTATAQTPTTFRRIFLPRSGPPPDNSRPIQFPPGWLLARAGDGRKLY